MPQKTKPKVGDRVLHHGYLHELVSFQVQPYVDEEKPQLMRIAVFENERFQVKADESELVWSEDDQAWYLAGRVLGNDERTVVAAITGAWPPAEAHLGMRLMLDGMGPLKKAVDMDRLKRVVRERRVSRLEDESTEDYEQRVSAYATAALVHAEAHRAARVKEG